MCVNTFEKYKEIIEKAAPILMAAEQIKMSSEFQQAMAYMRVQKMYGRIIESPSRKNGYTIEVLR